MFMLFNLQDKAQLNVVGIVILSLYKFIVSLSLFSNYV